MEMCLDSIWADFHSHLKQQESIKIATTRPNDLYTCECGGQKIPGNDDGFPTCTSCGIVDSVFIDDSPEWVNCVSENGTVTNHARCGQAKDLDLFSEHWGGSQIQTTYKSSKSTKRLSRINFHMSMNHKDRALYHAYKSIETPCQDVLNLSDNVIRDAKIMYRTFNADKLTRGAIRTGIKANCVLYACKMNRNPRTTKEVAGAFGIPTRDISRTTDLFRDTLLPKSEVKQKTEAGSSITKPSDVLARILNDFHIENKRPVQSKCNHLADKLEGCVQLMGKTPNSIAAVIVLKILGSTTTKQNIVAKCGVSMPTLNKIELIINKYLEV